MHHLAPVPARPTLVVCPPLPERAASTDSAETHSATPAAPDRALGPASRSAHPSGRRGPALTLIPGGRAPSASDPDAVQVGDSGPSTLCANLARCVVEILAGARSLDQIARWVTDAVYAHLLRRSVIAQRTRVDTTDSALRPRVHIGAPKLSSPTEGVVEAVVMVHQPGRSRAVAIRLERHRSRWRASAINVL